MALQKTRRPVPEHGPRKEGKPSLRLKKNATSLVQRMSRPGPETDYFDGAPLPIPLHVA